MTYIGFLYEELRRATDGGSESMTHEEALKQIRYWRDAMNTIPYEWAASSVPTATRDALAEDALQQHTDAYQMMEQPRPTCERDKLINRLRLGASISRDRRINEDFAAIADDAADMLEADAAWYTKGDKLMDAGSSPLFSVGQWWADRPWRKKT
jgi:hypothetical protein